MNIKGTYISIHTRWIECSGCGLNQAVASGSNAELMPMERLFDIMLKIGWQIAPKFKCPNCKHE